MEIKNENEFVRSVRRADVYTESAAEYILPDYNGDVRKLLLTEAQVRPAGKFANDGEVEFSGIVVYNIIYSDAEGRIASTSFTSDYEHTVKCSAESYVDAFCDTRVANFSIRLVGPRKISAKASVVGSVTLCERDSVSASGSAFSGEEGPELSARTVNIRNTTASQTMEREYAEVIATLDGAIADEVRVIYSGADVEIDDVEVVSDGVKLEGDLTLYAIIQNGDEPAYFVEKEIEIEEILPYEGALGNMKFIPSATVVSLKETVNPSDTGSEIVLSAIVEYSVRGEQNTSVSVVSDAYMKTCVTENTYDDFCYSEFVDSVSLNDGFTAEVERSTLDIPGLREIVCLTAVPKIEGVVVSGDTATVSGEVRFTGVASELSEEGNASYSSMKFAHPFARNVNLCCQITDKTRIEPKVSVSGVRGSLDANKVYANCKMTVAVLATEEKSLRSLSTCNAREDLPFEAHPARVTVYYPDAGETLFSVAKKFHTTPAKVAADNSISETVSANGASEVYLSGVKKLIIT